MALLNESAHNYYSGNDLGSYQFISLDDVINNFLISYVGGNKIIGKVKRTDVAFHAQRGLQEFSYDTLKSIKSQEITLPPSLVMSLPQDYVNYVKLAWVDSSGIEHIIYPTSKTSNPTPVLQNSDGDYALQAIGTLTNASATVVLDDEYTNILVGMTVLAPNIPIGTTIDDIVTAANITTITLSSNATYTGTETLTFTPSDGSLVLQEESSITLLATTWITADDKITVASTTDADSIKVGMLVSDQEFPVGTTVTDINGVIVTVSNNSVNAGTATSLTFLSDIRISDTWSNYKSATPSENNSDDYEDDTYWPMGGSRFGLDPQHAQANGSYYIDEINGKIHFSSNINGNTVILKYISDGLGTDGEMIVHKFAEEAMYKYIAYAILSTRLNTPEQLVARFKKERFAETRKAKLRLSNIKIEELTQILRGKSKQIKH